LLQTDTLIDHSSRPKNAE
jgi:hypothetical protein